MPPLLKHATTAGLSLAIFMTDAAQAADGPKLVKTTVTYRTVDGHPILADIYRPDGDRACPVIVWIHGGALIMGHREEIHPQIRALAEAKGYALLSIDYRLAPEHPYPAQLEDSLKVWRWMREEGRANRIDPDRIIAAGDSAGGQMSAALALTLRDLGLSQLQAMVLIYPWLGANLDSPSYQRNANAPGLTRSEMMFYMTSFLGPEGQPSWSDEKALPNLAQNVEGLPPAFITVAGHDPLYDDGVLFHEKLRAAGIASELRQEPQLAHSYMRARHHSTPALESFKAIVEALKKFASL